MTTSSAATDAKAAPPLQGIRVVDFSRLFAGPYCTMMLADLGAEVVKVEAPVGDDARRFGPPFLGGEGMNFMALNRGKRGIVLDLKLADGREAAQRLIRRADVLVENFRPGVAAKLGIDYETTSRANPGLVYCSISGFGREGIFRDRPALDIILQAMAGVMHRQGHGDHPELVVITVADTYAASLAVQSILAALLARQRDGGLGQFVEVTLLESLVAAQGYRMVSAAGDVQLPAWDDTCPYQAFKGSDGKWFVIAVVSEANWRALCGAIGLPQLADDPRFRQNPDRVANRGALIPELEHSFETQAAAAWLQILEAAGVPSGPVRMVEDLFTDGLMLERGTLVATTHPRAGRMWTMGSALHLLRTPVRVQGAAPIQGMDTADVLAELGYGQSEVNRLLESGAASGPALSPASERS
jgi:crotonobetainyl-CoA:carnitine CoA-transferase CaiB-like acyl-CoA transferase